MIPRFDLLVIGRDDQRVQLVAETDLPLGKAEVRLAFYEQLEREQPVYVSMARAGMYFAGEDFVESWHEEEE